MLCTTYCLVLTTARPRNRGFLADILSVFRETVNTFLDVALIFTAVMLASSVYRYSSFVKHQRLDDTDPDAFSLYQLISSTALSIYCVFPCLILQMLIERQRTSFLRVFSWVAVIALTITTVAQYMNAYGQLWDNIYNLSSQSGLMKPVPIRREALRLSFCDDMELLVKVRRAVTAGYAILGVQLSWSLYSIIVNVISLLPSGWSGWSKGVGDYQIRGKSVGEPLYKCPEVASGFF